MSQNNTHNKNRNHMIIEDYRCPCCSRTLRKVSVVGSMARYTCDADGTNYSVPIDNNTFHEYRSELNSLYNDLPRFKRDWDSETEVKITRRYKNLSNYSFVSTDPQYHYLDIAIKTQNFNIKYKPGDHDCESIKGIYDSTRESKAEGAPPLDLIGSRMRGDIERWIKPTPLWVKLVISASIVAILVTAFTVLALTNRTLVDEVNGVTATVDSRDYGIFGKLSIELEVRKIDSSSSEYQGASTILQDESKKFTLYDLTMLSGSNIVHPRDKVRIEAPLPEGYSHQNIVVYYVRPEDGTYETVADQSIVLSKNLIVFDAEHCGLYAIAEHPKSIKFEIEGASIPSQSLMVGDLITEPDAPTRQGYTFLGWYNGDQKWDFSRNTVTASDMTLVGKWLANTYTVTLDMGYDGSIKTLNVDYDSILTLPTPQRTGFIFLGWLDENGNKFDGGKWTRTDGVWLTASWKQENPVISFNANGGNGQMSSVAIEIDTPTTLPQVEFTRPGYTFIGWSDSANGNVIYNDRQTIQLSSYGTITLYAMWQANTYKITYDANGGTGYMPEQFASTDETVYLNACGYTLDGYNFLGWATSPSGNVVYTDRAFFKMNTGGCTLYAVWGKNVYRITYHLNGGTNNAQNPATYDIYSGNIQLANPYRDGYSFVGWYTDAVFTNKITTIYATESGNKDLFALWSANDNLIVFDSNGGSGYMADQSIKTDSVAYLNNCTFIRDGYNFIGWATSPNGGVVYQNRSSFIMGTHGCTLYAVWSKNSYAITYHLNGGTNSPKNPSSYDVHSETLPLSAPTRDGYTFLGWYSDSSYTTRVTHIYNGETGNKDLFASWAINENVLHFNANGGSGYMADQSIKAFETAYLNECTFVREGYNFLGWATSPDGDVVYANKAFYSMESSGSYNLYAVWSKNTYSITYYLDGGINNTNNPSSYDVNSGTIMLETPARDGYTFLGWYSDSKFTNKVSYIASGSTGNLTFFALWTVNANGIHFDSNGGSGYMADQIVKAFETVTLTKCGFVRQGYDFLGWSNSPNGGVVYQDCASYTMGTENSYILYAVWSKNVYTVTYHLNGGENDGRNPSAYDVNSGNITLINPTKAGYTFLGWYTDAKFEKKINSIYSSELKNLELFACWSANINTLTFNANGGNGQMNSISVKTDEKITLPKNTFTHEYYMFGGWSNSANGSTMFSDCAEYVVGPAESVTLYAIWIPVAYNITYDLQGGSISGQITTYTPTTPTFTLPIPQRDGYTFIGWSVNGSDDIQSSLTVNIGSEGDLSLKAHWEGKKYKVSFDLNDGDRLVYPDVTVAFGEAIDVPPPERYGLVFDGWYVGDTKVDTDSWDYNEDVTLKAKWSLSQDSKNQITKSAIFMALGIIGIVLFLITPLKELFGDYPTVSFIVLVLLGALVLRNGLLLGSAIFKNPTPPSGDQITISEGKLTIHRTSQEEVEIPYGVIEIGDNVFSGLLNSSKSLEVLVLPETVTTIGIGAFANCPNLRELHIGSNVESINNMMVSNCPNLKTIYFDGTEEEWNSIDKANGWDIGMNKSCNIIFLGDEAE